MPLDLSKRSFIIGALAALSAPAIVRSSSLMPVKAMDVTWLQELHLETITWTGSPEVIALLRKRLAEAEAVMIKNLAQAIYSGDNWLGLGHALLPEASYA